MPQRDYPHIRAMHFSQASAFDVVLDQLAKLEREINTA
jgi:hypothetical protein